MDVAADLTEPAPDPIVGPAFDGAAEIDANHFPENARVDAFRIIIRQGQVLFLFPN
jgi:hypothetical protein